MKKGQKSADSPKLVLGIDPGQKGALVWLSENGFTYELMPLDPDGRTDMFALMEMIATNPCNIIYVERAKAFQMGVSGAFNYGRDFQSIIAAIKLCGVSFILIDPHVWTKVLHADLDKRLKPKEKSLLALDRYFPKLKQNVPKGPRSGKYHEGVVDALLIAEFGLRQSK
jgi:hypothetical protein